MKRILALMMILLCLASPVHAEETSQLEELRQWLETDVAQPVQKLFEDETVITASGIARRVAKGDVAVLSFTITVDGETVLLANEGIAAGSKSLVAAVLGLGVEESAIRHVHYDVSPQVQYHNTKLTEDIVVNGYRAETEITVRVTDMALISSVIDAVMQSGIVCVHNLTFESSDAAEAYNTALKLAIEQAVQRADSMAAACGLELQGLISVTETSAMGDEYAVVEVAYRAK